jgi:hypothetical protein
VSTRHKSLFAYFSSEKEESSSFSEEKEAKRLLCPRRHGVTGRLERWGVVFRFCAGLRAERRK